MKDDTGKELKLGEVDASFEYEVHYMDDRGKWFIMMGRNYDEGYRHAPGGGRFTQVTASADEAADTAQALVNRTAHPDAPRSRYYRRVLDARVLTRVSVATVSAVYTNRPADVPRETSEPTA